MKTILMLLISLFSFFLTAQTNIAELERIEGVWRKKGELKPFTGEFIEKFSNGKVKGTGFLENGILEGERVSFYENEVIRFKMFYKNGTTNGKPQINGKKQEAIGDLFSSLGGNSQADKPAVPLTAPVTIP